MIYVLYGHSNPHNVIAAFFVITHVASHFISTTVNVSAENVRGFSTPAARVTWSTTAPPQCVTSVRVDFRTQSNMGPVVTTNTTTNTSQTEVIQSLQCGSYYITVVVTGATSDGIHATLNSRPVQVVVGGKKKIICMHGIQLVQQFDCGTSITQTYKTQLV